MATVYKVEVVSHWISYSKEELEKLLTEAVKKIEREKGNEIQIKVEERSMLRTNYTQQKNNDKRRTNTIP